MRSDAISAWVTFGAVAAMVTGCSQAAPPAPPPRFNDSTGEATSPQAAYPAGPYGIGIGSVMPDFNFDGYANPASNKATMQAIALSDFFNPHGLDASYKPGPEGDDRLFPTGSPYGEGQRKPTVLLIDVASVWCVPCNQEAASILPALHALYKPCGGEFFLDLHDSATMGTAASPKNLYNWTTQYKVDFPSAIDPTYKLDQFFVQEAFPQGIVLNTTNMTIVKIIPGAEPRLYCSSDLSPCAVSSDCATAGDTCTMSAFWATYEAHLDKSRAGCTL
jgi:hypothetical protein